MIVRRVEVWISQHTLACGNIPGSETLLLGHGKEIFVIDQRSLWPCEPAQFFLGHDIEEAHGGDDPIGIFSIAPNRHGSFINPAKGSIPETRSLAKFHERGIIFFIPIWCL